MYKFITETEKMVNGIEPRPMVLEPNQIRSSQAYQNSHITVMPQAMTLLLTMPTFSGSATSAGGRDPGGVAAGAGGRRARAVRPPEGAGLRGRHGAAAAADGRLPRGRQVTDEERMQSRAKKLYYAVQFGCYDMTG